MTSYFSSLLTTTTSRVASIRQNLLPTENDGDTEDDTHICRVLRGYYTEKGRAFPAWLPPDPKAPPPVVVQPVYSQPGVGARYGGLQTGGSGAAPAGSGALSSLWDSQPQSAATPPPPDSQSLRRPRGGQASSGAARQNPFARHQQQQQQQQQHLSEPQVHARPLPSQKAGSYQVTSGNFRSESPQSMNSGRSAQDRLKDRFRGGARSASPATGAPSQPSGGGNYEDRFAPQNSVADKPFMAATSPWATSEAEFGGGGYYGGDGGGSGGGQSGQSGRRGLPSGPRAYR